MIKIFKYVLEIQSTQTIQMPLGCHVLSVQQQYGKLCLWAEVNPDNPTVDHVFDIYGTGHEIDLYKGRKYLGTVVTEMGKFVWHVYQRI